MLCGTQQRTEQTAINYRENNEFDDTKYEKDLSKIKIKLGFKPFIPEQEQLVHRSGLKIEKFENENK